LNGNDCAVKCASPAFIMKVRVHALLYSNICVAFI